jgi:putative zinc-dependent peptidase DUF5700
MRSRTLLASVLAVISLTSLVLPAQAQTAPGAGERVQLRFDTSEAEAVLAILAKRQAKQPVEEADWRRLFQTEPYIRLKKREASLHRDFTDADFQKFVRSDELAARAPDLEKTLADWKQADLSAAAGRALAYLPDDAVIHAKVFPVIKPQVNSFVFEVGSAPTIFLFLDPKLTRAQFENTVAHELHHIGYSSIDARVEAKLKDLPPDAHAAVEWAGAFGEGYAMLAAAGGPDIHPHAVSKPEDRARWDHDMANFNQDLKTVDKFLLDVAQGKLKTEEERSKVGYSFFGVQGPWYTVGWKMSVVIEKRYGRAKLIECMTDPRELLATYNQAAAEHNRAHPGDLLALWSPELLQAIEARK